MTNVIIETDDFLSHFGVKGMHWGVRHEIGSSGRVTGRPVKAEPVPVLTKKFSTGDSVSIYKDPPSAIVKFISARFPNSNYTKDTQLAHFFTFRDKDGTKVGDASFDRRPNNELYLNWVGIKAQHRGKGYASAAMQGVVTYARKEGIKKLTLEVPGNAPDARHIYEKFGFRDDPVAFQKSKDDGLYDPNDVWGGLTPMHLELDSLKHANSDLNDWENTFAQEFADFLSENLKFSSMEVNHSTASNEFLAHLGVKEMPIRLKEEYHMTLDTISSIRDQQTDQTDDFLAHFGVKGMHWGIRHQPTSGGGGGRSSGGGSSSGSSRSSGSGGGSSAPRTGLSRNKKIAIGVGAAAVVALGTAAVIYNMKTGGKLPVNALKAASDLKGSAFKAANGGFNRAKAISEIASREARAVPGVVRVNAKNAGMMATQARKDIGGVARTTGQGVSRLAGMGAEGAGRTLGNARLQAQLGGMELRSRGGVAGVAGAAARGVAGNAAGTGRAIANDLQGLSEGGRATFSRIYGEEVASRIMANGEIASARMADLKGVAKTTATGVSRLAGAAPGVARKAAGAASAAVAKSGPQALANYQFRKITKGM